MRKFFFLSEIRKRGIYGVCNGFCSLVKRMYLATKTYNKLLKITKQGNYAIVIFPQKEIGDNVYALAYLECLCKKVNRKGKNVAVIARSSKKNIFERFNFNAKIDYLDDGSPELKLYQEFCYFPFLLRKAQKHDIYTTLPWAWDRFTLNRGSLEIIREMYGLTDEEAIIQFPRKEKIEISHIEGFRKIKNRIAVLNASSRSLSLEDPTLFERIAYRLTEIGYIVYSNVLGEEKPIKGTIPLDCSIFEFYSICDEIPLVVSIRSGIIDLCISANTNFYIIYPKKSTYVINPIIYSLYDWGTNNVVETLFDGNADAAMNEFEKYLIYKNLNSIDNIL